VQGEPLVGAFKQSPMVQKRKYFKHSNNRNFLKKQKKPKQLQQMTNGKNEIKETWELWSIA
jgi:hypothetical protein